MLEILSKIPQTLLLPVLILLLIGMVFVVIKAFREGRSFKIWGFEIGQRPDQSKNQSKTTGALTRSTSTSDAKQKKSNSESRERHSPSQTNVSDLDVSSAQSTEVIATTDHSVIEKRRINGKNYVVKRTNSEVCQLEAIEQLVGTEFTGYDTNIEATVATPLQVWLNDDHVWEVHPFYEGISLLELVRKNKYPIRGELLGRIFNVLIHATSQIHELGILHRDLNPSNIFITGPQFLKEGEEGSVRLLILDCSFCCRMDSTQVPVRTSTYTAPEQLQGAATNSLIGIR